MSNLEKSKEVSLNDEFKGADSVKITEKDIFLFGKQILIGVLMIAFICLGVLLYQPNNETAKTLLVSVLPSFATLVIGYYFGKS